MRFLIQFYTLAFLAALLTMGCDLNESVSGSGGKNEPPTPVRISPSSAIIDSKRTVVVLTLSGGNEPFTATVSDATLGSITPTQTTARSFNYRPSPTVRGVNTIRITDRNGNAATATVVHPDK